MGAGSRSARWDWAKGTRSKAGPSVEVGLVALRRLRAGSWLAVVCMIFHVILHSKSKAIQHDLDSTTERVFNLLTITGKQ